LTRRQGNRHSCRKFYRSVDPGFSVFKKVWHRGADFLVDALPDEKARFLSCVEEASNKRLCRPVL